MKHLFETAYRLIEKWRIDMIICILSLLFFTIFGLIVFFYGPGWSLAFFYISPFFFLEILLMLASHFVNQKVSKFIISVSIIIIGVLYLGGVITTIANTM